MISLFATLVLLVPQFSEAQESVGMTICKNKGIVRTIRVEKDSATDQFVTLYTKSGKDKEVGRARWKPSAEGFQTNIKNNLEKAGWECTNVQDYKVTSAKSS